jgi:uncharacterized protein (TIGR02118 family)
MITVNILYPNKPGSRFDMDYYVRTHMPMAFRLLAATLKRASIEHGLRGEEDDSPPPYIAMAHLQFESFVKFLEVWLPAADELTADIPNYTDIEPVIQISEVMLSR